jgi:hypothetical protein
VLREHVADLLIAASGPAVDSAPTAGGVSA